MAWSIGRNCLTKNHWNPQWFTHFFSENRTLSTRLHVIRGAILAHGHHPPSHLGHVLAPSGTTWGQVRRVSLWSAKPTGRHQILHQMLDVAAPIRRPISDRS